MNYYQKKCDGVTHTIRQGDTLYRLSRLYGVSLERIMDANPNVNVYNLTIGDTLCIPMEMTPEQNKWQTGAGLDWMVIMPYEVKAKDSLGSILQAFDMDFDTFASYNPKLMSSLLPEGETVYVKRKRTITGPGAQE